jgi:hypothetical protein
MSVEREEMVGSGESNAKQRPRTVRRSVRLWRWFCIFLIVFAVFELSSYMTGRFYIIPRRKFIFYLTPDSKDISKANFEDYMKMRHPILGWPSPSAFGGERFDGSGSRWIPSFPDTNTQVVSLYGDSYTYGADVGHRDAWSNVLSKMIGARVANFGVGGYGTDQAYLRFKFNIDDHAETVILTIFPDNLKRNVNQQRYFLSPHSGSVFGLKPRFIPADDSVRSVSLPEMNHSEFVASFDNPRGFFDHEFFIPNTSDGPIVWSFPYSASILKAISFPQVRYLLAGKPGWYGFLDENHPSGTLVVTALIIREFVSLAERRNKRAIVVTLPSHTSYDFYKRSGELAMQPLLDRLKEVNVVAYDLTDGIHRYLAKRDYSELKVSGLPIHQHFNAEGNRLIAELVYQLICKDGCRGS